MRAYKFLRPGGVAPFTGFNWPLPRGDQPGAWVEAGSASLPVSGAGNVAPDRSAAVCAEGVHACRLADLPHWVTAELWEIELDGEVTPFDTKVVAPRGRLVRRIDGWSPRTAGAFAAACAWKVRDLAVAELRRDGAAGEARSLARCRRLGTLAKRSSRMTGRLEGVAADLVGYAGDAAGMARAGEAGRTALIAALAASDADAGAGHTHDLDSPAFVAERRWQADWLRTRLKLPAA